MPVLSLGWQPIVNITFQEQLKNVHKTAVALIFYISLRIYCIFFVNSNSKLELMTSFSLTCNSVCAYLVIIDVQKFFYLYMGLNTWLYKRKK